MALLLAYLPTALVTLALLLAERGQAPALEGARRDDWRNLQSWALCLMVSFTVLPLVPLWRGHALIDGARLSFWPGFALFLVVRDLGEYLFHRAQHAVPFLWAMHALHHSDPDMAVLTTQRHFWGDQLIKQLTVWSAALMVISPTNAMVAAYGLVSLWNLLSHARVPLNFGRWSWVINSPAYHRRHHSALPEHYDSNFAALFPIFDVIAGSYHRPRGMPPTGLERQPESLGDLALWPLVWHRTPPAPAPQPAMAR